MANEQVKNHEAISNNKVKSHTEALSDRSDMKDTVEFRILMAYATRRRPKTDVKSPVQDGPVVGNGNTDANKTAPSETPTKTETKVLNKKKNKKNKGLKHFLHILKCVKPQTEEEEPPQSPEDQDDNGVSFRCVNFKDEVEEEEKEDELMEVVSRLTKISDEIPFIFPELETDSKDDDVERVIGLILRKAGDRLNEQELKNVAIARELFWDYSFFRSVISGLLYKMGLKSPNPDSPGPHASPKTQIAVACEATTRLSALDTQPMNKLLGFGAKYLNECHSVWVQEEGGYEKAFESDDEDDVQ